MCGFNSGSHDVNMEEQWLILIKLKTLRKINFHHIKRRLLQFLQMLLILIMEQ